MTPSQLAKAIIQYLKREDLNRASRGDGQLSLALRDERALARALKALKDAERIQF
jgi:hypothetical protein